MQAGNAGTYTLPNLWSEHTCDSMCPSICVLPNADQALSYVSSDHGYILISMAIMFPLSPYYCKWISAEPLRSRKIYNVLTLI